MTTSVQVRSKLVEALQIDLIGPTSDDQQYAEEKLIQAPSKWYLTGFLAPVGVPLEQKSDDAFEEELDQEMGNVSAEDNVVTETISAKKAPFPSSMGLSFLVSEQVHEIEAQISWGDYFEFENGDDPKKINTSELPKLTSSSSITISVPSQSNVFLDSNLDQDSNNINDKETKSLDDKITEGRKLSSGKNQATTLWERKSQHFSLKIPLHTTSSKKNIDVGNSGLKLVVINRSLKSNAFAHGTRSVSVFLVNYRTVLPDQSPDSAFVFQASLTLQCLQGFIPRTDLRGTYNENHGISHEQDLNPVIANTQSRYDWDDFVADLQYRNDCEFAVGHNVSVVANLENGVCQRISTTWLPQAEVPRVAPATFEDVELTMETIASADSASAIQRMLSPMVTAYENWIKVQEEKNQKDQTIVNHSKRLEVTKELLNNARRACRRIARGLALLEEPDIFEAFKIANRAISVSRRQQLIQEGKPPDEIEAPQWRPFQLAFILLNLESIVYPESPDREIVDLLFFPTGGGKTEAYLGLAAFTLVLRRFRYSGIHSAGLTVLMRYTLRLLTLDQLERASRLICALEIEREKNNRLGKHPFEIGLWVGSAATPNKMGKKGDNDEYSARAKTIAYQRDSKGKPSPIPLERCPWCAEKFLSDSFTLIGTGGKPNQDYPTDLRVTCRNRSCHFRGDRPLPIIAVDEPIYRRLPCFMIATVDKFANLPWVGQTAALFGKVSHYQENKVNSNLVDVNFYGPADITTQGKPLSEPLPPPELIIQDELHLISGPLGTMVGLYETAIDALCTREINELEKQRTGISTDKEREKTNIIRPKIIASTATVRRAQRQIQALFDRPNVDIFPPPGPDRHDSFFAETIFPKDADLESSARLYLGVAAQGRSPKVIMLRVYLALLAAAQKQWELAKEAGISPNPADPYMTVLGYFNSLRELGGSRRLVEDEINPQLQNYGTRRVRFGETQSPYFANRKIDEQPEELTSRVSTNEVAQTKNNLTLPFELKKSRHRKPSVSSEISQGEIISLSDTTLNYKKEKGVDVALATNMISVGLDIVRLGLMVVLGQPKSAAEYIQSTSRVGRNVSRPGLVVTLLNVHRPRDRSHYERFSTWHSSFYRAVEATSVTPFSPRALDRGLAGVMVALARLSIAGMTNSIGASRICENRIQLEELLEVISRRAEAHNPDLDKTDTEILREEIRKKINGLMDIWQGRVEKESRLQYAQNELDAVPALLLSAFETNLEDFSQEQIKFKAQRSLRDVEPTVEVWVTNFLQNRINDEFDTDN